MCDAGVGNRSGVGRFGSAYHLSVCSVSTFAKGAVNSKYSEVSSDGGNSRSYYIFIIAVGNGTESE